MIVLLLLNLAFIGWVVIKLTTLEKLLMADTTTNPATENPTTTPVQSTDINSALVSLFGAMTAHDGVETATLQAALDQHAKDQTALGEAQTHLDADTADKTVEDAALATAQANQVSPAILSSIDAATNALNSGQPLPPFPGAPVPDPIPAPTLAATGTGSAS